MVKIQELEDFKLSDAVKFNDTLNPAIWQDEKLKPNVRDQLEKIARHFAEYLGVSDLKIEDITISGSNAAFTWTPHSDLDLHLLVDFSKLPDSKIYQELFTAKKMLYNDDHNITVKGIPVELYVQDTNQEHHSMGEYSILNDDWIHIPKKEKPSFDEAATKLKYEKLGSLVELALKSKDLEKVNNVLSIIRRYRKAGLSKTGEFGPENISFKLVRRQGLIQKLYDLKTEIENQKLSLKEKNDLRFKTALTKDVKTNSIQKNAKAFSWKTDRAGNPPELKTNGKINEQKRVYRDIITSYTDNKLTMDSMLTQLIEANMPYSHIADIVDCLFANNRTDKIILENKNEKLFDILSKLVTSYSTPKPVIGEKYIPVMFALINDNIHWFDVKTNSPAVNEAAFGRLLKITPTFAILEIDGFQYTYPNQVIREISYFSVILVESAQKYEQLRTQVSLQFDQELPRLKDDITENMLSEWNSFLAETQQEMFPGYDKQHRANRLEQWLQNTLAWDGTVPKIVYHATTRDFDQFKTRGNKGFASVMGMPYEVERHGAFFAEDPKFAEEFIYKDRETEDSGYQEGARIIPVYLSLQNPIDLTDNGLSKLVRDEEIVNALEENDIDIMFMYRHMYEHNRWQAFDGPEGAHFVDTLEKLGFDGAVMVEPTSTAASGRVWVAFRPEQIKSAIGNRGSFSKDDPRITRESR